MSEKRIERIIEELMEAGLEIQGKDKLFDYIESSDKAQCPYEWMAVLPAQARGVGVTFTLSLNEEGMREFYLKLGELGFTKDTAMKFRNQFELQGLNHPPESSGQLGIFTRRGLLVLVAILALTSAVSIAGGSAFVYFPLLTLGSVFLIGTWKSTGPIFDFDRGGVNDNESNCS